MELSSGMNFLKKKSSKLTIGNKVSQRVQIHVVVIRDFTQRYSWYGLLSRCDLLVVALTVQEPSRGYSWKTWLA